MRKPKEYRVWFTLKMNNHAYVHDTVVTAHNKREAFDTVERYVQRNWKRHAFHKTTKAPVWKDGRFEWDGYIYTHANEFEVAGRKVVQIW